MDKKKYLSEENYEKGKKKLKIIGLAILVIGLLIGGSIIGLGISNEDEVNSKFSEESKETLAEKVETEKQVLLKKKAALEAKGIKYDAFAEYTDGEVYDLYIITKTLDPGFDACRFDEYKNNSITTKYCSLKLELDDISAEYNKDFALSDSIPFYMIGAFVIMATCIFSGFIFFVSKGREIAAFTTQQAMPVAQEAVDAMAPSMGNAAKELAKGIKEGLKDDEE